MGKFLTDGMSASTDVGDACWCVLCGDSGHAVLVNFYYFFLLSKSDKK